VEAYADSSISPGLAACDRREALATSAGLTRALRPRGRDRSTIERKPRANETRPGRSTAPELSLSGRPASPPLWRIGPGAGRCGSLTMRVINERFGGAAPCRGWRPGRPLSGAFPEAPKPARGLAAARGGRPTKLPLVLAALAVASLHSQTIDQAMDVLARGDTRAAETALEMLAKSQDKEAKLARGVYLFQLGRFVAARQGLEPLGADPRAETFLLLSRAAMGECATVTPDLRSRFEAVGDARLRRFAGLGAAQCAIASGDIESAAALLNRLRDAFPADADVLYLSARFHLKGWN